MAATFGLRPWDVERMTFREIELWIEGRQDDREWWLDTIAWAVANLMNVHIGRGKKVRMEDLRPKSSRRRRAATETTEIDTSALEVGTDPKKRAEAAARRVRDRRDREEAERFWKSEKGRRMLGVIGEREE